MAGDHVAGLQISGVCDALQGGRGIGGQCRGIAARVKRGVLSNCCCAWRVLAANCARIAGKRAPTLGEASFSQRGGEPRLPAAGEATRRGHCDVRRCDRGGSTQGGTGLRAWIAGGGLWAPRAEVRFGTAWRSVLIRCAGVGRTTGLALAAGRALPFFGAYATLYSVESVPTPQDGTM